jgi:hypothetical protein
MASFRAAFSDLKVLLPAALSLSTPWPPPGPYLPTDPDRRRGGRLLGPDEGWLLPVFLRDISPSSVAGNIDDSIEPVRATTFEATTIEVAVEVELAGTLVLRSLLGSPSVVGGGADPLLPVLLPLSSLDAVAARSVRRLLLRVSDERRRPSPSTIDRVPATSLCSDVLVVWPLLLTLSPLLPS